MQWENGSGVGWVAWVHSTHPIHSISISHDLSPSLLKLPELPENNTNALKPRGW